MEQLKTYSLKPDVYKSLSSCSICDYASRVKHNAVKHLKLHLKEDKLIEIGALEKITLTTVTPVNPSPIEETETSAYSRMKSLLPKDEEKELYRKPITDLALMPSIITKKLRHVCSDGECGSIAMDALMLPFHTKATFISWT